MHRPHMHAYASNPLYMPPLRPQPCISPSTHTPPPPPHKNRDRQIDGLIRPDAPIVPVDRGRPAAATLTTTPHDASELESERAGSMGWCDAQGFAANEREGACRTDDGWE